MSSTQHAIMRNRRRVAALKFGAVVASLGLMLWVLLSPLLNEHKRLDFSAQTAEDGRQSYVHQAEYYGKTQDGEDFTIWAQTAEQIEEGVVELLETRAALMHQEQGKIDMQTERLHYRTEMQHVTFLTPLEAKSQKGGVLQAQSGEYNAVSKQGSLLQVAMQQKETHHMRCDQLNIALAQDTLECIGHVKARDTERKLQLTSQKALFYPNAKHAVFMGDVQVMDPKMQLYTPTLDVYFSSKAGGTKVERAEANAGVYLVNNNVEAKAKRGLYQAAENTLFLEGDVRFKQGNNWISGPNFTYHLASGKAVMQGRPQGAGELLEGPNRIRGIFTPEN